MSSSSIAPDIPPDWVAAMTTMLAHDVRRVLLLGPVDAGKSTFCRVLAEAANRAGRSVALVDADPGQKMVGPPAAITRSQTDALDQLAGLAFVGTTNAARSIVGTRRGMPRLVAEADADLLIVNTSGLLVGAGRMLKSTKIAAVRPELIIALGDDPAMEPILAAPLTSARGQAGGVIACTIQDPRGA